MAATGTKGPSFREVGRGPGVVCLHSSASSSGQWRPLLLRLADRYRVLAADLHGYGQSPPWPEDVPLTLGDEAELLEPVFQAAGEPFHLVGHSYGAAVALRAALANPRRISSLVLFEPVFVSLLLEEDPRQPAAREIDAVRDDTSAAVARGDLLHAAERFVDYWMGAGAWSRMPESRRPAIAGAMRKVRQEWNAIFTDPTPLSVLARIDVETLLLVGADSPASGRGVVRLLERTLPRVTVVEVPGVGHMAPVTHPDLIDAAIAAHLDGQGQKVAARRQEVLGGG